MRRAEEPHDAAIGQARARRGRVAGVELALFAAIVPDPAMAAQSRHLSHGRLQHIAAWRRHRVVGIASIVNSRTPWTGGFVNVVVNY
jgi:hypothetical protein